MYVTYFDEVKAQPSQGQTFYLVGGICVPIQNISEMEAKVNALADDLFQSIDLLPATAFHARMIYFKKGPFKDMDFPKRLEVMTKLADVLVEPAIKRVYAAIDTGKLHAPHKAAEFAFAHFCERVQMAMAKNERTILIGDLDNEQFKKMIADFSKYRARGTPWEYGINIESIVDSVHFARSHHSRMIQLADMFVFIKSHYLGNRAGGMAKALTEVLKGKDLHAHRYKFWPN